MSDIEVHIDLAGDQRHVGLARRNTMRGAETIVLWYAASWLADPDRFSIAEFSPLSFCSCCFASRYRPDIAHDG